MSDLEKVIKMRNLNWTPAVTYWKDKYLASELTVNSLKDEVTRLNDIITQQS